MTGNDQIWHRPGSRARDRDIDEIKKILPVSQVTKLIFCVILVYLVSSI